MALVIEPTFPVHVGRCIYCRNADEPLTDEHIIPFALEGEWILQRASCARCARITSAVERELLRGELLAFRTKLEFRNRRKKERPSVLTIAFTRDGSPSTRLNFPSSSIPLRQFYQSSKLQGCTTLIEKRPMNRVYVA